jgi:hypothetical protein
MTWRKYTENFQTQFRNTDINNRSIWRNFVFQQNLLTATVNIAAIEAIKQAAQECNLSIVLMQLDPQTFQASSQDKKSFARIILNLEFSKRDDLAYALNSAVKQELNAVAIDVPEFANLLKRLEALEQGVQYQNKPMAKQVEQPLFYLFKPSQAVTKDSMIAANVNKADNNGALPLYMALHNTEDNIRNFDIIGFNNSLEKLKNLIAQGANLNSVISFKDNSTPLQYIFDQINHSSTEQFHLWLQVAQILIINGANINKFLSPTAINDRIDHNIKYEFVTRLKSQNSQVSKNAAAFACLLMHHGAISFTELMGYSRTNYNSPLELTTMKTRILNAYNSLIRQSFLSAATEGTTNNDKNQAAIEAQMPMPIIMQTAAVTDPDDIGRENRDKCKQNTAATKIQNLCRAYLARPKLRQS